MNVENIGFKELTSKEFISIDGGNWFTDVVNTVVAVETAIIVTGVVSTIQTAKFGLGLLAGVADGIADGMKD